MSSTVTQSARLFTRANSEYFSITNGSQSGLSPGDVDFYIAGWFKFVATDTNNQSMVSKWSTLNDEYTLYLTNADAKPRFYVSGNGATTTNVAWSAGLSTATWYFIEAYHDSVNNLIGVCVNRGTDATTSYSSGVFQGTGPFTIGTLGDLGSEYFYGSASNICFISGIPTSGERNSLYNSGNGVNYVGRPTLSVATYTSWWDGAETSGKAFDAKGSNNLTDNNTVTTATGKVTYTAEDASQFTKANSEYLSKSSPVGLVSGSNSFYFCAWIYLNSSQNMDLIGLWGAAGNRAFDAYYYDNSGATKQFQFYFSDTGTNTPSVTATNFGVVPLSTWVFLECYYDTTNIGICVNRGTDNTAAQASGLFASTAAFEIGAVASGPAYTDARMAGVVYISGMPTTADRNALFGRGFGVDYSDKPILNSGTYVSWWELTESSGSRADSQGSNTLTDNNTVTGNPGVVYDVPTPVVTAKNGWKQMNLAMRLGI